MIDERWQAVQREIDITAHRWEPRLIGFGYDRNDIKQEAALVYYQCMPKYDPKNSGFTAYFTTCLHNHLKNLTRVSHPLWFAAEPVIEPVYDPCNVMALIVQLTNDKLLARVGYYVAMGDLKQGRRELRRWMRKHTPGASANTVVNKFRNVVGVRRG